MPTVGKQQYRTTDPQSQRLAYASSFSHKNEIAEPGYYSVFLDTYQVKAEISSTKRGAIHRYTFPENAESGVIIDLDYSLQRQTNSEMEIEVISDTEICGHKKTTYWAFDQYINFYAKFSIASGRNKMTLKTRNFSGTNATFFKVTAIRMDGTLMHLAPASNTAQFAEAAADGCWKFIHEAGGKGDPEGYADFVYDLSQFNGEDVMLTIGIFKGEENGDENKLVLRSITME